MTRAARNAATSAGVIPKVARISPVCSPMRAREPPRAVRASFIWIGKIGR
jgi:hypothetical protein